MFSIVRDSACAECGVELWRGNLLRIEDERPLCLSCADLDHLVFLPSGDAALTRRAKKYSTLHAVVVRFSRARKRYEREGLLVEDAALDRAEGECLADAEARSRRRMREATRRADRDAEHASRFASTIGELYPGCPHRERQAIAEHACKVRSGRVGRTAAAKQLDPSTIELAVRARVRHVHTTYDTLLASGRERQEARRLVEADVEKVLDAWRA